MADERKGIERQICTLVLKPALQDLEPFSLMREEVLSQASRRLAAGKQKRKARLRAARRVALATACLLIGICVFAVLAPVPAGTAGGFLRSAQVWIGNVLHINVQTELNHESGVLPQGAASPQRYDTLEAASAACGLTLYQPAKLPEGLKLGQIKVNWADGTLVNATYSYQDGTETIYFIVQPLADEMGINIFSEDVFTHEAPAGTFQVFTTEGAIWAVGVLKDAMVSLKSTQDKDAFLVLLDSLEAVR